MKKVIFLDRDGVINKERGEHTFRKEDFEFVDGLFDALLKFQSLGFEFIIITNQSGVAKGLYTKEELSNLHQWMLDELIVKGISVLDLFYCPHFTELGRCICRKPDSNMLERAIAKHNVDVSQSLMIGDSDRDILSANKVGLRALKIEPNSSLALIEDLIAL